MKPIRSFLFVPGNKESWIEKSVNAGADALILDLEDSVPSDQKAEARNITASKISWLAEQGMRVYVRINRGLYTYDHEDVAAIVGPHLEGIVISKPCGPEDIHAVSMMVSEAEYRKGMVVGSVGIIPLLETARSMQLAYEIAQCERVTALCGASAKNADSARSLGFVWSPEGRESHYMKSRAVMAARAAGKLPIGGVWQQVRDIEGLRAAAELDRALGMSGELCLHPGNVAVLNEVYSPNAEEVAYYQGMLDALEKAQAEGRASTMYDGEHIDIAHAKTAQEIIELAKGFSL